jgi:2-desacetyl-2-hydroxyethyl bacteriochlorophyllide A dehydrogenase
MLERQIVFEGLGRVAVHATEPPGTPGVGEAVIVPAYVGICGSDLHVLHGRHPWIRPPLVTGHEIAAVVESVGDAAGALCAGDHVVLNPLVPCGTCRRCRAGAFNRCEAARVIGFRLPGAARTRLVVPARQLHAVPADLPLAQACLVEPLAVGVHAAGLWDDLDDVLIIGGGTIGLCVLLALRARGAGRVTVCEPVASKRELALRLGATETTAPEALGATPRYTAAFDCVAAQPTLDTAFRAVLAGGAVITVGVPAEAASLPLPRMQRFEISLLGSGMYLPADIDAAVALIASGRIDVTPLISVVRPLDDAPAAYAEARRADSVKILIRMS